MTNAQGGGCRPVEDVAIQNELSATDDGGNASFEQRLFDMIQNILLLPTYQECDSIYWDIIELLSIYLEFKDYESNLISSWILKIIALKIVKFSKVLKKCDYKKFILWLYEEIKLVTTNKDMKREEFFELMMKLFYLALSKILEGKGLWPMVDLLCEETECEEEYIGASSTSECDDYSTPVIENREEVNANNKSTQAKPPREYNKEHLENLLNIIIECTYDIFGKEVDYLLIQSAANEENVIEYVLPYHYRKPRATKLESTAKATKGTGTKKDRASRTPPKGEKAKKRRKSSKQKSSDRLNTDVLTNVHVQPSIILPLSEAVEASEVLHGASKIDAQV